MWIGLVMSAIWLFFLQEPFTVALTQRTGVERVVGLLSLTLFVLVYLVSFPLGMRGRMSRRPDEIPAEGVLIVGALAVLATLVCVTTGQPGTATWVFVGVCAVHWFPFAVSVCVVVSILLGLQVATASVPAWTEEPSLSFAVAMSAFAMYGFTQLLNRNVELVRAKEENARLAVADERGRFARDLHDILGHTLTVITVKAELAERLVDQDPERAKTELEEVQRLGRDALADVRRAVGGYSAPSLAGELARASKALEAAGIKPDLPTTVDDVPSEFRELFAWAVREGVTNVIRHSGATRCLVRLEPHGVRIEDDGRGPAQVGSGFVGGHGLAGLRERAAASGAVLVTSLVEPRGFVLEVSLA
ncbi:MAG: sensor histidine kinase [Nocardioides sp.]|uniref:sensor histidine kinase n=1 Tax=Nocardioides sp. TaxID=35761 RepID=UPI0039E48DA4